ncbi:MAG: hypothetical protein ACRD1V_01490, partial [Vicinamibacterales bacterium]
ATLVVVQGIVCAVSAAPVVVAWRWMFSTVGPHPYARVVLCSAALAPSYVVFAMCLMIVSPLAVRALGWRTPPDTEMRIAEMDWALLAWVRYGASMHLARIVAGTLVRGTPIWTFHLRLAGARLGRRVFVNSLTVSDYNLIECGDDVVIGSAVHMSGHTVEAGIVKTAGIRLADNVTLGIGAVIEIGVTIEANTQIGALSFVPKYTKLKGDAVYAGAPVTRLESAPPL